MRRILVTGACGQLGRELTAALRRAHGTSRVVAADRRPGAEPPFELLDVESGAAVRRAVERHAVGTVYHLAALKSAEAERRRAAAWNANVNGLYNALEALRPVRGRLFFASSVAAAGRPVTLYGVTKRAGELLCDYFRAAHGVDARSLRLGSLLSPDLVAGGGGVTDFALEMVEEAAGGRACRCPLAPRTRLPFMHLSDAVAAIRSFMAAPAARLDPPVGGAAPSFALSPELLARELARRVPGFRVDYSPDPRLQALADSWASAGPVPRGWTFRPAYGLRRAVEELLAARRPSLPSTWPTKATACSRLSGSR